MLLLPLMLCDDDLRSFSTFLQRQHGDYHMIRFEDRPKWSDFLRQKLPEFQHEQLVPSKCALALNLMAFQSACISIPTDLQLCADWKSSFVFKFRRLVDHIIEVMLPDDYGKLTCSRLIRKRADYFRALKSAMECCGLCFRVEGSQIPMPISLGSMFDKIEQQSAKRRRHKSSYHSKNLRKLIRFLESSPNLNWAKSGSCVMNYETLKRYQHILPYCCLNVTLDPPNCSIIITTGFFNASRDVYWTPDVPNPRLLTIPEILDVYQHFQELTSLISPYDAVLQMNRSLSALGQYRRIKDACEDCSILLRQVQTGDDISCDTNDDSPGVTSSATSFDERDHGIVNVDCENKLSQINLKSKHLKKKKQINFRSYFRFNIKQFLTWRPNKIVTFEFRSV